MKSEGNKNQTASVFAGTFYNIFLTNHESSETRSEWHSSGQQYSHPKFDKKWMNCIMHTIDDANLRQLQNSF
eukprot:2933895-Amphidinium_carterae.1